MKKTVVAPTPAPAEAIEDLIRKETRRAVRNILIFAGVKAAIFYGLSRLRKAATQTD